MLPATLARATCPQPVPFGGALWRTLGLAFAVVSPAVVAAQNSVTAQAAVERTLSYDVGFTRPAAPGCAQTQANTTLATAGISCVGVPNAMGTAFASVSSSGGVLRAQSSLVASGLTLGPAGSGTDVLSAVGRANLFDVVSISPLTAVTPTSFTLFVDWDGTYRSSTALPTGVSAYTSAFLGFIAAGFDPLQRGWSGWTWSNSNLPSGDVVDEQGNARFAGLASRTASGGVLTTAVDGRSSFVNIPFSSASFDFSISLVAETMFRNVGSTNATMMASLASDFAQSARITGFQVFAGNQDVTSQVRVSFASGYAVPLGEPPSIVPEPATVVLVGSGVLLLVLGARRRRCGEQLPTA